ncbi:MAG: YfiR family protein, partial [Acidobacteriaceae bacterium]
MVMRTTRARGKDGIRRVARWRLGGLLLALIGLASAAGLPSPGAQAQRPSRDEVEAAYLYNFGRFVRWPAEMARGPLVICVAAQDSLAHALGSLTAGEEIDERPLQVKPVESPGGMQGCSILFISSMGPARVDAFLAAAAGKPILTVGDGPDFLARGGTIQFVLMEDHVRFSVNLSAANRGGLGLSSELLKVAVSVTGKPGTGGSR